MIVYELVLDVESVIEETKQQGYPSGMTLQTETIQGDEGCDSIFTLLVITPAALGDTE